MQTGLNIRSSAFDGDALMRRALKERRIHMKRFQLLAAGMLVLMVASTASAVTSTVGQLVTSVDVRQDSSFPEGTAFVVQFASSPNVGGNCGTNYFAYMVGTYEHTKAMHSLAVSAFLSGRKVIVSWNGSCYNSNLQITNLKML
jgi:hypothetical protein